MKKLLIILFSFLSLSLNAADWYVSPTGSDAATGADISHPWRTWHYAFNHTPASDTCYFRGGNYTGVYSSSRGASLSSATNQGTRSHPTCFFNYGTEVPVFDCDILSSTSDNIGVLIFNSDNYYFKGLILKNVRQLAGAVPAYGWLATNMSSATLYAPNNIKFENCTTHHIGGIGFGTAGVDTVYFTNCDAYIICDTLSYDPGGGGVGFGSYDAGYSGGANITYIYHYGCRAWQCSDQGFAVNCRGQEVYDHCWSINNSNMDDGNTAQKGSGFKFWFNTSAVKNINVLQIILRNSIAVYNEFIGINWTDYNNTTMPEIRAHIYNNFCYKNGINWDKPDAPSNGIGFGIEDDGDHIDTQARYDHWYWNNISYDNLGYVPWSGNNGDVLNGVFNQATNKFDVSGTTISDLDFVSLDTTGLCGARQADGSLPVTTFGHLTSTSECINAGTNVGLPYKGAAPDIGWFEFDFPVEPATPQVNTAAVIINSPTTVTVGGNTITDGGSVILTKGVYWATHSNPTVADNVIACGSGSANYTTPITGLVSGVTYHVKAYVTNAVGAGYGADESWVMPPDAPVVTGGPVGTGGKIIKHLGKIMIVP